jgi:hypothetical protein
MTSKSEVTNTERLIRQITHPEDYREASRALAELARINPIEGERLAVRILKDENEEIHFRTFALTVFYDLSKPAALTYIIENAASANRYMFYTMIDEVTVDSEVLRDDPHYLETVHVLARLLAARPKEETQEFADAADWFKKTFEDM